MLRLVTTAIYMPGTRLSRGTVDVEVGKSLKTYEQLEVCPDCVTASSHSALLVKGNIYALFTITRESVGFVFIGRIFTSGALVDSIISTASVACPKISPFAVASALYN